MKHVYLPLLYALVGLLASTPSMAADIYKWQDVNGRIRYTDQLPPSTAKNVQKLKVGSSRVSTEKLAEKASESLSFATKQATEKYPVVLFSFEECGEPCKNAETLLEKRGIPYTLKNKDADKVEMKQVSGGLTAPVLVVGKEIRKGFEAESWGKLLDAAGYASPAAASASSKQ